MLYVHFRIMTLIMEWDKLDIFYIDQYKTDLNMSSLVNVN